MAEWNKSCRAWCENPKKGDREAFTQLLLECEQMLSRVAMAILQDPEDAADAVQDAVLAAWESLGQLRQPPIFQNLAGAHPAEQVLPHRRLAQ